MFGLSTEASPSKSATKGNFSIRGLLKKKSLSSKTKALSRQPEVPNLRESKPTPKMERSKSAPNLPTITEERDETMEADVEDNEQVSPDSLSSQEDTEAQEDTNLAITAKPAAGRLSYSPVSASSSDLQIELKTIDKRVSELESCLASTQEQLKERDEQLFECQHATSEHIAEKIAKVVDSKDQEIEQLVSRIAALEADVKKKTQLIQKVSMLIFEDAKVAIKTEHDGEKVEMPVGEKVRVYNHTDTFLRLL